MAEHARWLMAMSGSEEDIQAQVYLREEDSDFRLIAHVRGPVAGVRWTAELMVLRALTNVSEAIELYRSIRWPAPVEPWRVPLYAEGDPRKPKHKPMLPPRFTARLRRSQKGLVANDFA